MKSDITVHKLNEQGEEVWTYDGMVLDKTPTSLTLEARFDQDDTSLGKITIRRGDRFVETFYNDRWYNIFAIRDGDDAYLKGWYCNISRPARIEDSHIYAEDLALDLIVYTDGGWLILDEDEYASLNLSPEEDQKARDALEELIFLAQAKMEPFSASE
ncbi:MAG: DUF402 domain-containing protein [Anaerolineales bacterium]|nr:DUF402 domain-containing protein [Anaerolineales bacterium]